MNSEHSDHKATDDKVIEELRRRLTPSPQQQSAAAYKMRSRRQVILDKAMHRSSRTPSRLYRNAALATALLLLVAAVIPFVINPTKLPPHDAPPPMVMLDELDAEEIAMSMEFFEWMDLQKPTGGSSGG